MPDIGYNIGNGNNARLLLAVRGGDWYGKSETRCASPLAHENSIGSNDLFRLPTKYTYCCDMRLIGKINNKLHAERFVACMTLKNINAHVEQENSAWDVWIKDEDQVDFAKAELDAFVSEPDSPKYAKVVEEAASILKKKERARQEHKKNVVQIQDRWQSPGGNQRAPVTMLLIVISVLVSLATSFGKDQQSFVFRALAFTSLTRHQAMSQMKVPDPSDPAIRTGSIRRFELWRTVTPIFLHFGVIHLLFNGLWMFYFGRQIEGRYGSVWLAILVLAFAIPSNAIGAIVPLDWEGLGVDSSGEVWVMPAGGLSGVLYGMFGYIWMKTLFDRNSGLYLSQSTIVILVGWFFLCILLSDGLMRGINNWAHGGGLVIGLIMGYFPKFIADIRGNPPKKSK